MWEFSSTKIVIKEVFQDLNIMMGAFASKRESIVHCIMPLPILSTFHRFSSLSIIAGVAELVDARDSKSRDFGHVGSSPTSGTIRKLS